MVTVCGRTRRTSVGAVESGKEALKVAARGETTIPLNAVKAKNILQEEVEIVVNEGVDGMRSRAKMR